MANVKFAVIARVLISASLSAVVVNAVISAPTLGQITQQQGQSAETNFNQKTGVSQTGQCEDAVIQGAADQGQQLVQTQIANSQEPTPPAIHTDPAHNIAEIGDKTCNNNTNSNSNSNHTNSNATGGIGVGKVESSGNSSNSNTVNGTNTNTTGNNNGNVRIRTEGSYSHSEIRSNNTAGNLYSDRVCGTETNVGAVTKVQGGRLYLPGTADASLQITQLETVKNASQLAYNGNQQVLEYRRNVNYLMKGMIDKEISPDAASTAISLVAACNGASYNTNVNVQGQFQNQNDPKERYSKDPYEKKKDPDPAVSY